MTFDMFGVAPIGAPHDAEEWVIKFGPDLYAVQAARRTLTTDPRELFVAHLGGEHDGYTAGTAEEKQVFKALALHLLTLRRDF